uniref:Uncharacterized protein n=1 Tax=Arundo donax TaxID=35708 RepID=A0A0A9B2J4_ARUDO
MSLAGAAVLPARACPGALAAAYADVGMGGKSVEICELTREWYNKLLEAAHCSLQPLLRLLVKCIQ